MKARSLWSFLPAAALGLAFPAVSAAQATTSTGTVAIAGHPGQIPVVQIGGRSYVDVYALARLAGSSISGPPNQLMLHLAPAAAATAPPPRGFSPDFLRASIEQMSAIREWRAAIVNAVQNNVAVTDSWVSGFRRSADNRLSLSSAAARTDDDRKGFQLLQNESNNMQRLSDGFLALNRSLTFTPTTAFDNNPLDTKILACAHAMVAMAASNQFQDEPSCH